MRTKSVVSALIYAVVIIFLVAQGQSKAQDTLVDLAPMNPALGLNPDVVIPLAKSSASAFTNIHVYPSSNHQSEISAAVSGVNTNRLLVGANVLIPGPLYGQGYYYSTNGGSAWSGGDRLLQTKRASDPSVAFDLLGNAYFNFLDTFDLQERLWVSKSSDGGITWQNPVRVDTTTLNGGYYADKNYMAIDENVSSPYKNNIYVVWTQFPGSSPILFSRSTDNANTFAGNLNISGNGKVQGAVPAVGPQGEVYVVWGIGNPTQTGIGFNKSTNGGASFIYATPPTITSVTQIGTFRNKRYRLKLTAMDTVGIRVNSFPSIAVDRNNGNIYVVWADMRNGTPDILLIKSADGGISWSALPTVVNDTLTNDQWFPWVNVGPDGAVNVVYYDSRHDPNNLLTETYIARSLDGGQTFTNYKVSDVQFTPVAIPGTASGYMGDYISVTSTFGKVFPFWMDNRAGGIYQIYAASVVPSGEVTVDQKLEDGITTVDSIARWATNSFQTYKAPKPFQFVEGTSEVLRGTQKIILGQKYNKWDRDNNVVNHRVFTIDTSFNKIVSNLKTTNLGVVIKNELIDAPSSIGGAVEFKDPWLIDYNDSLYGMRNRGMSAPFKSRPSPFYPDSATSYNGDVYQGVFLDQDPANTPAYYSVRVPQAQTIGSYPNCNFLDWTAIGYTQVVNPTSLESPVIFKGANDIVKARYKGNMLSSISNATANSNQHKLVRDAAGAYHMIYESGGEIWYTKSTNLGTTWENEIKINNYTGEGTNPHNPSMFQYTNNGNNYLQVVWVENAQAGILIRLRECTNGTWSPYIFTSAQTVFDSANYIKPAVDRGWVVYDYRDGSNYRIAVLKLWGGGNFEGPFCLTAEQCKQPAIYVNPTDTTKAQIVYANITTSSIKHRICTFDTYYHTLSWSGNPLNIDSVANRSNNCNPSISGVGHYLCVTWQGYNTATGKTEIIARRGWGGSTPSWYTPCTYFSSQQTCTPSANFSMPSIRYIGYNTYGLTWQSDDKKLSAATINTDGTFSMTQLSPTNATYPTLSEYEDGSSLNIVYTKYSASAPYALLHEQTILQTPFISSPVQNFPPNGQQNVGFEINVGWNCTIGASSYQVQVSTTDGANFLAGKFRDQSGITALNYQPGGLDYDIWYYWRVRATNGITQSDWSPIWSFKTYPYSPPSCPYVFSWNGNRFVIDNNIIPQSEYPSNEDKTVTDYYKLTATPKEEDGNYILELKEFEHERTKFDQVKLLAIDHDMNNDIAVLSNGDIVEYSHSFSMQDQLSDQTKKLSNFEGDAYETKQGDHFELDFEPSLEQLKSFDGVEGGILLGGWVLHDGKSISSLPGDKKQSVGVVGNKGVVGANSSFTFRERGTVVYVPLEKLQPQVNISFHEKVAFDYASLVAKVQNPTYTVEELKLNSAIHSKIDNITSALEAKDGMVEELYPDESIKLTYQSSPITNGKRRSFILVTTGRYNTISDGESFTRIPTEFQLKQNYPNPFNPSTNIKYQLQSGGNVSLVVYNQLGQEVDKLVDGYQEAGYFEKMWDAATNPSGTYYIRLLVTDQLGKQLFLDTKKLVVMK